MSETGPTPKPIWRKLRAGLLRALMRRSSDRLLLFGPLLSLVLFLAAAAALVRYAQQTELQRERDTLQRDSEWAKQRIALEMQLQMQQLQAVAAARAVQAGPQLPAQALAFLRQHHAVVLVYATDAAGRVTASARADSLAPTARPVRTRVAPLQGQTQLALEHARLTLQPTYTEPYWIIDSGWAVEAVTPVLRGQRYVGSINAVFAVSRMLRSPVAQELSTRYALALVNREQQILASSASETTDSKPLQYLITLPPFDAGLGLRVISYHTAPSWSVRVLYWAVMVLSALMLWMLWGTWRQMRERLQTQETLTRETAFRRAMENSLSTGIRVIDLKGCITYVNAAFCKLTGFDEAELLGSVPPYPYWPHKRLAELRLVLQQEMDGLAPPSGFALRLGRKDGSEFDARMFVSPLIDARGRQTGWVSSATDITEPTRIRHELAASHERFVAVLEGLDAAVSVLAIDRNEQLYANKLYRQWFGASAHGHYLLSGLPPPAAADDAGNTDADGFAGLPAGEYVNPQAQVHEVRIDALERWFDVRQRYIQWVDGRIVQMLIATDVTARRQAEDVARNQEEKAQITSRLIAMGEMASSLAHELNQPLTAINNYCSGMLARLRNHGMPQEELQQALDKTARQAQRAAGVIRRVRDFVKKSEPHRVKCRVQDIVQNTLELAEIELRRRNVRLFTQIAAGIPLLLADPILIEQVLLNLLRNAAEAVDKAGRQGLLRSIDLSISAEPGQVAFCVLDHGTGMPDDVLEHLFEAFFTTKPDGLGIGLNICRSIVEFHHGRLWAENQYNDEQLCGTAFHFTLPVDPPPGPASDTASS